MLKPRLGATPCSAEQSYMTVRIDRGRKRGQLTFLDAVLFRALMVRILILFRDALDAFVVVVLQRCALGRFGAFCTR